MIRGPILPLSREGLWRLVRQRSELLERGLRVIAESLDLGAAASGLVDGLLRDAAGTAVLVFTTDDRDTALPARVLGALAFWRRNAVGMPRALPEADLRDAAACRLVIVGSAMPGDVIGTLERLQLPELEIVEVESFQIGGQERLVVRPLRGGLGLRSTPAIDVAVGEAAGALIAMFAADVTTMDPRVRIDGDRFSRRASIDGQVLAECWFAGDRVHGAVVGESARWLQASADVRSFVDGVARRYLSAIGRAKAPAASPGPVAREATTASVRSGFDVLRASVSAARLSREECSALSEIGDAGESGEESLAER